MLASTRTYRPIFLGALGVLALAVMTLLLIDRATVPAKAGAPDVREDMVYIPGGTFRPLYDAPAGNREVGIEPFLLGRYPVTNEEFLAFVIENPEWQRSRVPSLFADENYLRQWEGDTEIGIRVKPNSPVVNVSWFAATAFAGWRGARLPSVNEWEYAASAGTDAPRAVDEPEQLQRILAWYSRPTPEVLPAVGSVYENYWGVHDLHGLVWEWTADFNSVFVTGDARNNSAADFGNFCGAEALNASEFKNYAAFIRYGYRNGLEATYGVRNLGFRLAADAPAASQSKQH